MKGFLKCRGISRTHNVERCLGAETALIMGLEICKQNVQKDSRAQSLNRLEAAYQDANNSLTLKTQASMQDTARQKQAPWGP